MKSEIMASKHYPQHTLPLRRYTISDLILLVTAVIWRVNLAVIVYMEIQGSTGGREFMPLICGVDFSLCSEQFPIVEYKRFIRKPSLSLLGISEGNESVKATLSLRHPNRSWSARGCYKLNSLYCFNSLNPARQLNLTMLGMPYSNSLTASRTHCRIAWIVLLSSNKCWKMTKASLHAD